MVCVFPIAIWFCFRITLQSTQILPMRRCKADIRNLLSLLAHERSRFATCQWELLTPTDISIPLTHRLVLYALEAGECLFCVQSITSILHTCMHRKSHTTIIATVVWRKKLTLSVILSDSIITSVMFESEREENPHPIS